MKEIERKFLLSQLPTEIDKPGTPEDRYFLYIDDESEIRIQQKGSDTFTLQNKARKDIIQSSKQTITLTVQQFNYLKMLSQFSIQRKNFTLSGVPNATVKVYDGRYKGLIRVEIEFETKEQASLFQTPDWFGPEITDTALGRDKSLAQLSENSFKELIGQYQTKVN